MKNQVLNTENSKHMHGVTPHWTNTDPH